MNKVIADFFACDGGPHVLLPASAASSWNGMGENYDPLDPETDYVRACNVEPPVGTISVGDQDALVIAGSPPMTAWGKTGGEGAINIFIFEEWQVDDLELLASAALTEMQSVQAMDTQIRWNLADKGVILMFAGDLPGKAVYGEVHVPLSAGSYTISYSQYDGVQGKMSLLHLRQLHS